MFEDPKIDYAQIVAKKIRHVAKTRIQARSGHTTFPDIAKTTLWDRHIVIDKIGALTEGVTK
jgi:hypothetical protein